MNARLRPARLFGQFLLALFLVALVTHWWRAREIPFALPNGFVIKGSSLLAPGDRRMLVEEVEFLCFDDRFVEASSKIRGQGGLFDAKSGGAVSREDHPEIYQPGGLEHGNGGCNGYYTGFVGPGLLTPGNRPPFLPSCAWVNRANPNLKDKAWLDRPCEAE